MNSGFEVDALVPSGRLFALVARSAINVQRSRALVAAADTIVRAACRIRRPKLAGGSDAPDAAPPRVTNPRVLRTWTKVKNGALPTDGARRRWVGPGRGERCNGCGDAITRRETEFERSEEHTSELQSRTLIS